MKANKVDETMFDECIDGDDDGDDHGHDDDNQMSRQEEHKCVICAYVSKMVAQRVLRAVRSASSHSSMGWKCVMYTRMELWFQL